MPDAEEDDMSHEDAAQKSRDDNSPLSSQKSLKVSMLPETLRRQCRQVRFEIEAEIVHRGNTQLGCHDGNQQNELRELLTKTRKHVSNVDTNHSMWVITVDTHKIKQTKYMKQIQNLSDSVHQMSM